MNMSTPMVELWRGDILESQHGGHAVICRAGGEIAEAWGDPAQIIYPRSSAKLLQAIPLIESGAAKAAGLTDRHLALACASHHGAHIHTDLAQSWLRDLGLGDEDLRCGPQEPSDLEARDELIRAHATPCQYHNNCSGKHIGFLTLGQHLRAGPEYVEADHPVQQEVRDVFEDMTGIESPGYGIDGCSAPNFATSLHGLARAMARVAAAREDTGSARDRAAARLARTMRDYPELIAGATGACTLLMQAAGGRAAVKTGAEAVYIAILPEKKLGIAVKIADGGMRAAECAIAALLIRLGVLEADHPVAKRFVNAPILNRRGIDTGVMKPSAEFAGY